MKFELFINLNGNCREAMDFYAKVFRSEVQRLVTYSQMPPDPDYTVPEADLDKVMYAQIPFENLTLMFMDYPAGEKYIVGNNISPSISTTDKSELIRMFEELSVGGIPHCGPIKTFYAELYASVQDKYGINWHLLVV